MGPDQALKNMIASHLTVWLRSAITNPAAVRKTVPGSLFATCVATAFLLFFQFTKHDRTISAILPFADDPYDAVGSFGVIIGALLSVLSIVRALQVSSRRRQVLAARTQAGVAAAVLVTLVTDLVGMGRHVSMWLGQPAAAELLALMTVMLALALLLWSTARLSVRESQPSSIRWKRPATVCAVAVTVLALYPESLRGSTLGELFTLLTGIVLLFIPMSAMIPVLVPCNSDSAEAEEPRVPQFQPVIQWIAIAVLGLGIGGALLVGEWLGEGMPTPALRVMLASIFLGAALVGLSIAYYFLRGPLALFRY